MRIDRLLFYLRFTKNRALAHAMAEKGHIRCNGERVTRSSKPVHAGDILVLPLGSQVRTVRILSLPHRRGPAAEAGSCYQVLDAEAKKSIAAPETEDHQGRAHP